MKKDEFDDVKWQALEKLNEIIEYEILYKRINHFYTLEHDESCKHEGKRWIMKKMNLMMNKKTQKRKTMNNLKGTWRKNWIQICYYI